MTHGRRVGYLYGPNMMVTTCGHCKKKFTHDANHAYKDFKKKTRKFCSYTCMKAQEKDDADADRKIVKRLYGEAGTLEELAEKNGVDYYKVWRYCRKEMNSLEDAIYMARVI